MPRWLILILALLVLGLSCFLLARLCPPSLREQEQEMNSAALRSLRDGNEAQREAAVQTLLISHHGAKPQLRAVAAALVHDPSARVRTAATYSLEFAFNQTALRLTDDADQIAACSALVTALADDSDTEVRSHIARFLPGHLREWLKSHRSQAASLRTQLLPHLERAQTSRDPRVRESAGNALRELASGKP